MATIQKLTETFYEEWTEVTANGSAFLQNRGGSPAEVWLGAEMPSDATAGIYLYPKSPGIQITLTGSDKLFVRDRDNNAPTIVVAII